jgi:hypothetical protein
MSDETRTVERRRAPRLDAAGCRATIGIRIRVRLLDISINGIRLGVTDDVSAGTRAWLTAVLGFEPLAGTAEIRRGGCVEIAGRLELTPPDGLTVQQWLASASATAPAAGREEDGGDATNS